MANNTVGFNYYNSDTDRYQDIKIKRLKKEFKCDGVAVYDYIKNEIYRVKGCFLEWDDSTVFDVADYWGLKENLVKEIVTYCCHVGLFDKGLLTSESVLTSLSIQTRFLKWSKLAKRKDAKIPEKYSLIQEEKPKIPEKMANVQEENDEVAQSKVKKSEVTQSKTNFSSEDFFLRITDFFSFSEQKHFQNFKLLCECCWVMDSTGQLEHFKNQTENYIELKKITGFKNHFSRFLGQQSERFLDGAWNAENWEQKLKEEKLKKNGNKNQRTTTTGHAVDYGKI